MEGEKRESRGNHQQPPRIALWCVATFAAAALWTLFVWSSINAHEMYLGAGCLALTLLFGYSVARTVGLKLTFRAKDLAQAWHIPWAIVTGAATITWVLFKDLLGIEPAQNLFRVCGFDSSRHDPVRIARTVLAVAYTTATPNSIVIGIDPTQSRLLLHQISRSEIRPMTKHLGAKG